MLRRERVEVRPRATLVVGWGNDTEEAFELWRELGARPIADPREASEAPTVDGVEFLYWSDPDHDGEWSFTVAGPDRFEPSLYPISKAGNGLVDGPWIRCVGAQRELAVVLSTADGKNPADLPAPGTVHPPDLGWLGVGRPMLGARLTAVERS